jgi:NAD(P)-dependent dehydrogenase (short-subunit alcohol dehydrogenase family)
MAKTFFITGASTGLGRALAETALTDGHRVVGTLRNETARAEFDRLAPGRSFGRILEVTDTAAIVPLVEAIEREVGAIDVLVNNAGYGLEGVLEEVPLDDVRRQFEVNVFGAIAVIQAVLPHMRKRRSGHIINITSQGGYVTFPGIGIYNGTKFALEGISDALAKEVKDLGIAVTAVAPGAFRTDWAGRSMVRAERSIPDYDSVFDPVRERRRTFSGNQPGDPAKAARALLTVIEAKNPPVHLLLGADAVKNVGDKLAALRSEIEAWEQVSTSTNFS